MQPAGVWHCNLRGLRLNTRHLCCFVLLLLRPCAHPRRVSEDFEHDPVSHMMQLPEWLGLDPALVSAVFQQRATVPNSKLHIGHYDSKPSDGTLQQLRTFFAPHNERHLCLLGGNP